MKNVLTSIINNKKALTLLLCFFIMGIIIGSYYYFNNEVIPDINNLKINNIYFHLSIISIIIVLSFLLLGIPSIILLYIYEGFSIGFFLMSFFSNYGIRGLLFSIIITIIIKIIYLLLLTILSIKIFKLSILLINNYVKRHNISESNLLMKIKSISFISILIVINDLLLYFIGNKLINWLVFII